MSAEEKYVAAAYLVVFLFVLLYVVIMAAKLQRLSRELGELARRRRERKTPGDQAQKREKVEVG